MKLYKVLGKDRQPYHGGQGQWPPAGEWLEVDGPLILCEHGLHLCREKDLVSWLGPEIWEVEYEGEIVEAENKVVVRKARLVRRLDTWNERMQRLLACDYAEHVLHLYEEKYPNDARPRKAIETARRFANGEATIEELAAAGSAAGSAALDAAWDAEREWQTARLMEYLYSKEGK